MVTGPLLALVVAALVVVGSTPVPYFSFSPGGARSVEPLVSVSQARGGPPVAPGPPDANLLYVTVSLRRPTAAEALLGVLQDKVQVEPSKPYLGTQSPDENRKLNQQLMVNSQDKARKVALERLGYRVGTIGRGAFLEDVDPSFAVARLLKPGAVVVGADDKPVQNRDDLVAAIQAHRPGDVIRLAVQRLGSVRTETVSVKLGVRPGEPQTAALGVSPVDNPTFTFPVTITIDTGEVGGPSAGLAFTLAILDRLTPGSLLGHRRVAVTGTIELDGSVGPVGGVEHKTEAAVRKGAEVFIVPPDEYALAKKTAHGRLRVEQAATLDQALRILVANGGDRLPAARNR